MCDQVTNHVCATPLGFMARGYPMIAETPLKPNQTDHSIPHLEILAAAIARSTSREARTAIDLHVRRTDQRCSEVEVWTRATMST
jgi:hypothetical protein